MMFVEPFSLALYEFFVNYYIYSITEFSRANKVFTIPVKRFFSFDFTRKKNKKTFVIQTKKH